MTEATPERLATLGAERLAAALFELAARDEEAARLVERLTAEPDRTGRGFEAGLAALRRRDRFVPYRETSAYAAELRDLLQDLEAGVNDPRTGVELVAAFYRSDGALFEACDDSDGLLGEVFRCDASDLFQRYAARCDDKQWLAECVFSLLGDDDYGVRDSLLDGATTYLPEAVLRGLAGRMWQAAESAGGASRERRPGGPVLHRLLQLEQMARQLNDPSLFEQARRPHSPELGVAACMDIAAAWLAAGNPTTALTWLDRIAADEPFLAYERDDLLRAIHEQLGHHDKVEELVWKRFHEARCSETLDELLEVIGQERRDEVVAQESAAILQAGEFSAGDAVPDGVRSGDRGRAVSPRAAGTARRESVARPGSAGGRSGGIRAGTGRDGSVPGAARFHPGAGTVTHLSPRRAVPSPSRPAGWRHRGLGRGLPS